MSLLETFSKKFGFTTEEDDENGMEPDDRETEEEDVDEEEDEEEDEEPRFSFRLPQNPFSRRRQQTSAPRSRTAARRDEEDEDEPPRTQRSGNVIHDPRMSAQAAASAEPQYSHCERIVCVRQIDECREIIKCLLRGESVLLNLENIDPKDCGRVVDLLSGAAFALQGRMLKVAHLSYLLAPENVEIIEGNLYPAGQARYR